MNIIRHTAVCLLVGTCLGIARANLAPAADRARLMEKLFSDYDESVAPSGKKGTVRVNHTIETISVVSLENNVLQLLIWNNMFWNDDRLVWNPAEFGNVTKMSIPSTNIWIPDILVATSIEPYSGFPNTGVNAVVFHDGQITFVPPEIVKSPCPFNADALYVNNTVTCQLKFLSWTLDCSELDLRPLLEDVNDNQHYHNNSWKVKSITAVRNEKVYSCCPDVYCDVTYTFAIERVA